MENMEKSFFEQIGIADIERIHSQIIAWIFSDDFNGIEKSVKIKLLGALFNVNPIDSKLNIYTERENIDILIQTTFDVVVIENKFKSSEHSDQLTKYQKYCEKTFPDHKVHFFFLTLIDDHAKSPWQNITYNQLYTTISELSISGNTHGVIFNEYLKYLRNVNLVLEDFKTNYRNYQNVFTDGSKKKSEKQFTDYINGYLKFIGDNQLETILQRCHLNMVVNHLHSVKSEIGETRGQALVDFPLLKGIKYKERLYNTAIQFQGGTVKFIFASDQYKVSKSDWVHPIIPFVENLKNTSNQYKRLNKPRSRAFLSISKKLTNKKYWQLTTRELARLIETEIEIGMKLSESLKKQLETLG